MTSISDLQKMAVQVAALPTLKRRTIGDNEATNAQLAAAATALDEINKSNDAEVTGDQSCVPVPTGGPLTAEAAPTPTPAENAGCSHA